MSNSRLTQRSIRVAISIGELIDKITILEIKAARITDQAKLGNIVAELSMLNEVKTAAGLSTPDMEPFAEELKSINLELWNVEDAIRALELQGDFGERFVALARSVYLTNDRRSRVKQRINAAYGSQIVEEKSYVGF
jgi:Family of unknown function (DUF6165)